MSKSQQPRAKHGHGITNYNVSDDYKRERKLSSVLTYLGRSFGVASTKGKKGTLHDRIIPDLKRAKRLEFMDEKTYQQEIRKNMFIAVLVSDFGRLIELLNPKDENAPRLLNRKQVSSTLTVNDTEFVKSSPYLITTLLSRVGKELEARASKNGKIFNPFAVTDREILEVGTYLNEQWEQKQAEKEAEQSAKDDKGEQPAEEIGELTIDHILNGDVNLNEIDDVDLLKEAHHFANSTQKGAITRRIKVLEVEI